MTADFRASLHSWFGEVRHALPFPPWPPPPQFVTVFWRTDGEADAELDEGGDGKDVPNWIGCRDRVREAFHWRVDGKMVSVSERFRFLAANGSSKVVIGVSPGADLCRRTGLQTFPYGNKTRKPSVPRIRPRLLRKEHSVRRPINLLGEVHKFLAERIVAAVESDKGEKPSHAIGCLPKVPNLSFDASIVPAIVINDTAVRGETVAKLSDLDGGAEKKREDCFTTKGFPKANELTWTRIPNLSSILL